MFRLLRIDFLKNKNYRTFWVLCLLYFITLGVSASSGMEFLKWLQSLGADFDGFRVTRIPLYHFPDIWHNMAYAASFFKYVLAIVVIISITNEFSYKTVRQNIIDGLDRWEFLKSKLLTILVLSSAATLFIFLIGLITGLIYTPSDDLRFIFKDLQFLGGFFLETMAFLLFALMVGTLVKRSGLAIGILFLYTLMIEPIITLNLGSDADFLVPYFPIRAINELVRIPFPKYVFMEIRDYVSFISVLVLLLYSVLFVYLTHRMLLKRDLQ